MNDCEKTPKECFNIINERDKRIEQLTQALLLFGKHSSYCRINNRTADVPYCSCGLEKALQGPKD